MRFGGTGPMIVLYTYSKCSTCRRATTWLTARAIAYEERPIGKWRRLFSRSNPPLANAGLFPRAGAALHARHATGCRRLSKEAPSLDPGACLQVDRPADL